MNYYERHIGDYLKDTAHLSLLEHGVYGRLLDVYYTREGGIPAAEAARLIGARSRDERAALETVLAEFFDLRDGLHVQDRCEREIERYSGKQAKAKASADARWNAQRSQSERNANASQTHMQPDSERNANALPTQCEGNAPRARTSPQSPDTSLQTPDTRRNTGERRERAPGPQENPRAPPPPPAAAVAATPTPRAARMRCPEGIDAQVWDDWLALRKAKRAPVTQTVVAGAIAEAGKAGMSLDAFLRVWCRRGSQGLEAAWLRPDERAPGGNGRQAPPIDTAARNAESRRLLGFAPTAPTGEVFDA